MSCGFLMRAVAWAAASLRGRCSLRNGSALATLPSRPWYTEDGHPMRFALPPRLHRHRHEAIAIVIAIIGLGMFIGDSILGPLISYKPGEAPVADNSQALSFEAMVARPDPFPYRTPTPQFDVSGSPHYAAIARQKALAALGDGRSEDATTEFPDKSQYARRHWRYRVPDRHRVY